MLRNKKNWKTHVVLQIHPQVLLLLWQEVV